MGQLRRETELCDHLYGFTWTVWECGVVLWSPFFIVETNRKYVTYE